MGIYLSSAGNLSCVVWPGVQITCSQGAPPDFYLPHLNMGLPIPLLQPLCATPCVCTSLPLLPVWMNVASLNAWLSDFHTARFSDSSGCYLFWGLVVILSVVMWGGKSCLRMPPSWQVLLIFLKSTMIFFLYSAFCMILICGVIFWKQTISFQSHVSSFMLCDNDICVQKKVPSLFCDVWK